MRKMDFTGWLMTRWPVGTTVVLHLLFWAAFFALPMLLAKAPPVDPGGFHRTIVPMDGGYQKQVFFLLQFLGILNVFYVNAFVVAPRFFTSGKYGVYAVIVGLLFVVTGAINIAVGHYFFNIPRDFQGFIVFPMLLGFLFSMVFHLLREYVKKEKEVQLQQSEHLQTELKFLRSQVNPHFLFNVLNSLVALARKKSDDVEPTLIKLSQLLQFMLYDSDQEIIALSDEVEYLNSYIALQKLRFGHSVPVSFHVNATPDLAVTIAPMLLIPLVENAFKHGVGMIKNPAIAIHLDYANGNLHFQVRNAFAENDTKDSGSGIGLNNLRRRLELLYPDKFEFETIIIDQDFTATLQLKLL